MYIDQNNADAWLNKGNDLDYLTRYEEGIKCYDKALQIDPNYALAWNNKGATLDELGKLNEAIECYDIALQIDPNFDLARNNKTDLLRESSGHIGHREDKKKIKWYTSDGKPAYE